MSNRHEPEPIPEASEWIDEIVGGFRSAAGDTVPWFVETMPSMYFKDTSQADRIAHLRALIAAQASGRPVELTLKSEDGLEWTAIRSSSEPTVLPQLVRELPKDANLHTAKIHSAKDNSLLVVKFDLGEPARFDPSDADQMEKLGEVEAYARKHDPEFTPEEARAFFHRCPADLILTLTPLRIHRLWSQVRQVSGTEGASVELEEERKDDLTRIVLTTCNTVNRVMLMRVTDRLAQEGIRVHRAYLDLLDDGEHGVVNHMAFVCEAPDGGPIDADSDMWRWVRKDLQRLKWVDKQTLALEARHDWLTITRAEIIYSLGHLVHQVLVKTDAETFNRDRILSVSEHYFAITQEIVQLFLNRFNPDVNSTDTDFKSRADVIRKRIESEVDSETARKVMGTLVDAVCSVLRTNVFIEDRFALAMRVDPGLLAVGDRTEMPYGVFFVHGRGFNGFHVRFRDIARGGVRAVRTIGHDQHARELVRLYDEVYGLAHAQQLKNKDIPEGGSKAVCLLESSAPVSRSVKAFVDALLDLITPDERIRAQVVDRFGKEELLYLGPDENITPELIEWVVARAGQRKYPLPTALMSSKPGAGINHKEYGVTSEGVTVFLDAGLRYVGINPDTTAFRVKITGGPDGDVAGNEIKILNREYGERAKIVGIADGSGSGEDPDGLDHTELLRLVDLSLPITSFDRKKLGPKGRVVSVDEPEGVMLRNTMHNRVEADAFVPAGGRPSTIHEDNWQEYLKADGRPSAPLIVEGANIYLTAGARRSLADRGTVIIKDSSANKCGVITSSFEIAACMLLEKDEFLAIKPVFVDQVLTKLRMLARAEAELILRLDAQHPDVPLFEICIRLSRALIRISDAILATLDSLTDEDAELFRGLVSSHLPPILVETAKDRLWKRAPEPYLKSTMAKSLATRIVYREGFEAFEQMPPHAIGKLAVRYLELDRERDALIGAVAGSDLAQKDRLLVLLERAGILSTLGSK